MTLLQLITKLQLLMDEHGEDIIVYTPDTDYGYEPVDSIKFDYTYFIGPSIRTSGILIQ